MCRTPLNVVLSGLEYMTAHQELMHVDIYDTILEVKDACLVAINILNDLLTYEKLDSNILELDKSACDIADLVKRAHALFSIQARYAEIVCSIDDLLCSKIMVLVDEAKFAQVVRNLISNALKFTPCGGSVTMKLLRTPDNKRVRVEVHDTGPGMTKEQRRRLFKEVVQFNAKELQGGQGSGLGLYLSHRIMQLHDGDIGVDTEREGSGSVFFLELPVSDAEQMPMGKLINLRGYRDSSKCIDPVVRTPSSIEEEAPQPLFEQDQRKLRFLIVDDAPLVRKFHMKILATSAEEFIVAGNGEEAVAKYREQMEGGRNIDAILMDSSMPFMNGTTATRLIRDLGYTGKVFGITGNAFQSDIDDFLIHGADEVLIKPLTLATYTRMIQNIREKPHQETAVLES
jgi:CheY-like chemotaxis protein